MLVRRHLHDMNLNIVSKIPWIHFLVVTASLLWPINLIRNYHFESEFDIESEIESEFEFETEFKVELEFEIEFESKFEIECKFEIKIEFDFKLEFKVAAKIVFSFLFKIALLYLT